MSAVSSSHASVRDLSYVALMAALMAICSWITIPLGPVPFTMQTFGVFAALGLLGGRRGTVSLVVYLLLGLAGLPVFAGFSSGAGTLMGATGGYLLGFLISALLYWAITATFGTSVPVMALAMVLGLMVCYSFGTAWFLLVYTGGGSTGTLLGALGLCVFPYIIPDLVKIFLVLFLVRRVGKFIGR